MKRYSFWLMILIFCVMFVNYGCAAQVSAAGGAGSSTINGAKEAEKEQTSPSETGQADKDQIEMLNYINNARFQAGSPPLTTDLSLNEGASLKSADMGINNYFSHISPTYGNPQDMMDCLGISRNMMGENLSMNFTIKGAFEAFMKSAPHRENMLRSDFAKVGIGCYSTADFLYVTLWFTD